MIFKNLFSKSQFIKNVVTLITGATLAQVIPFAIAPILTRLYDPSDFAIFAIYTSIATFVSIGAAGRFELSIVDQRNEKDANNILLLCLSMVSIISVVLLLITVVFNSNITILIERPGISNWLYLLPLTILMIGYHNCLNFWLNRESKFEIMSKGKVVQSSINGVTSIGIGLFSLNGLIIGPIIGAMSSILYIIKKLVPRKFEWDLNRSNYKRYIRKNKQFVIYNLPNTLIDGVRLMAINILIGKYFGIFILGYFSFAWRIVHAPVAIIAGSVGQVFFKKLTELKNKKNEHLSKIVIQFLIRQSSLGIIPFILLYFFSEDIFQIVFGPEWKEAGMYASILSPWLFFNFISSPLSFIFIVFEKQLTMLIISVLYTVVPMTILLNNNNDDFLTVLYMISYSMSFLLITMIIIALFITFKFENSRSEET